MSRPLISHIVLGTDFSDSAGQAQQYAVLLATSYDATLHVIPVPERPLWQGSHAATILYLEQVQREGEKQLADTEQQSTRAGLIVMGTHGRRGWSRVRFGSVAEAVLRQAHCPVLTVKSPKFQPGHRRVLPYVVE
ncbi:MAG TPA: universal stress protein [Nitrospira sp.]|nr:universal stress protein [Nitrospira sp.]